MAVKIRNNKTQEEKTVPQELWEKMRSTRKDWYAVKSDDSEKEAASKPVAVRVAPKEVKPKPEAEAVVLPEN